MDRSSLNWNPRRRNEFASTNLILSVRNRDTTRRVNSSGHSHHLIDPSFAGPPNRRQYPPGFAVPLCNRVYRVQPTFSWKEFHVHLAAIQQQKVITHVAKAGRQTAFRPIRPVPADYS